jgi:predicted ABC-type transport system involved in lysophospholipase L1 biosynthesis ATPase subunit
VSAACASFDQGPAGTDEPSQRPLILAAEPTANLDSAIGRQVARLLRQLATEDRRRW